MELAPGMVAVVTGAGSGIGRALARRLAADGLRVVAADVEADALEALALEALADSNISACPTDVADEASVEALARNAWDLHGRVDLLCNNAGVFQGGFLWECTAADLDWTFGVNLGGILNAVRVFVPRLIAQGGPAHIVNTASTAGLVATAYSGPYVISKFAAVAASECLAKDLAAAGAPVTVSVLCPSAVDTAIARSRRNRPAELAGAMTEGAAFVEQALAGMTATGLAPEAVAGMVVDGVRRGDFLIPTSGGYRRLLADRTEDLLDRRLPRTPTLD